MVLPATRSLFVSYASTDQQRVTEIANALEQAGVSVWLDRDGIVGGSSYGAEIASAIRQSPVFLLCVTQAALASRNVRQEIAIAWKHERPIIPLLLESVEIPAELEYWLEATQWIEVLDHRQDTWLRKLRQALAGHAVESPTIPDQPITASRSQTVRTNMPLLPPSVVGREADIDSVRKLLQSGLRLVTLTGPGGVGKTTVAIASAREVSDDFPDGQVFVNLAAINSTDTALVATAEALGIREIGADARVDRLAEYLQSRRILLLFDNAEHLPGIETLFGSLLEKTEQAALLVTSRRPLGLRAETEFRIAPLEIDAPDGMSASEMEMLPAVRLFLERGRQVQPAFRIDDANAAEVLAISRQLDGLPLAIELAAARLRVFSPRELLARLEQSQLLLTGGTVDAPVRQRTLQDTVIWSLDLLGPTDQSLFRSLAVFSGGFTLEAANAIVAGAMDEAQVLAGLEMLLANNLVTQSEGIDGETRYGMLATIHAVGRDQLHASPEVKDIRLRHLDWCSRLSERFWYQTDLNLPTQLDWNRLVTELPNFRLALDLAKSENRADTYKWIASNLSAGWAPFELREFHQILETAPGRDRDDDPLIAARYLSCWEIMQDDVSLKKLGMLNEIVHRAAVAAKASGDDFSQGLALFSSYSTQYDLHGWDAAFKVVQDAAGHFANIPSPKWIASCETCLGAIEFYLGNYEAALVHHKRAAKPVLRSGDPLLKGWIAQWLALDFHAMGDLAAAAEWSRQALQHIRESGARTSLAGWAAATALMTNDGDLLGNRMMKQAIWFLLEIHYHYRLIMLEPYALEIFAEVDLHDYVADVTEPVNLDQLVAELEPLLDSLATK